MKKKTNLLVLGVDLELPYSYGLMLKFNLIKPRTQALEVVRVQQRVVRYLSVNRKQEKHLPLETVLQKMNLRELAKLRKAVSR
jgi:hypothetical protein